MVKHRLLFVCLGNICRSPMAAALFNDCAERQGEHDQFVADSAGTWASDHQRASGHAMSVMAQRGLDLSQHRARTLTASDMDQADLVVVMTRSHREALAAEFPRYRSKVHLMSELQGKVFDIGDPYGGSLLEYRNCAKELQVLVESGYGRIKAWLTTDSR